jgi:hypothetical protein
MVPQILHCNSPESGLMSKVVLSDMVHYFPIAFRSSMQSFPREHPYLRFGAPGSFQKI